jgi:hypothetical protein
MTSPRKLWRIKGGNAMGGRHGLCVAEGFGKKMKNP